MRFTINKRNAGIPYSVRWTVNGARYENVFSTVQACIDYAKCIDRNAQIIDKTGTIDRWSKAVRAIGTAGLLGLPQGISEILSGCNEIDTKVKLLEAIIGA